MIVKNLYFLITFLLILAILLPEHLLLEYTFEDNDRGSYLLLFIYRADKYSILCGADKFVITINFFLFFEFSIKTMVIILDDHVAHA